MCAPMTGTTEDGEDAEGGPYAVVETCTKASAASGGVRGGCDGETEQYTVMESSSTHYAEVVSNTAAIGDSDYEVVNFKGIGIN